MPFENKPEGPELYDPLVADAIIHCYPVDGASHADWAAAVQLLAAQGVRTKDIVSRLQIPERRVLRLKLVQIAPYPDMMAEYDHSERRAQHLEGIADAAMGLVVDMRTDPYMPYAALTGMTRQQLVEVAMTLACMVNPEATVKQSLGWVSDGLAQVIPLRKEA